MIPIQFKEASTPRKPRKDASEEKWESYRELMKQTNLNKRATDMLESLQADRSKSKKETPPLHVLVDGSYTNRKMLKNLPKNTTLIGRIRKDAHLNFLPEKQASHGRKRIYGEQAPTPEQLRTDPSSWQEVSAYASGKMRTFRVKTIAPLRWRAAGKDQLLRIAVINPVPYFKKRGGRPRYRQPVYLICTDPDLPLETIVQEYIWRWDIEVNHRDEKTLLGVGEAQVRNPNSVESVPAAAVAAYAMLHVAAMKAYGWGGQPNVLPPPKWHNPQKKKRASTLDLINELRRELWASAIRPAHLTHFMTRHKSDTKSVKCTPSLCDALFYSTA